VSEGATDGKNGSLRVNRLLVPYTLAAWLGFLAIGIPLPVLSLFAHDQLGYAPLTIGIVLGAQSLATLVSRQYAGRMCDSRGPKPITLIGLAASSLSGLCYLAASCIAGTSHYALAVLLAGRVLLGVGESLFITGLAAWSVARVGSANAGRAMAWSGIAMYGALALGAPAGIWIYRAVGFAGIAWCTIGMPTLGGALAIYFEPVKVQPQPPTSYLKVLRRIWAPGLGMALASSGIGTISAFLTLQYAAMAWMGAGQALMAFGFAYILMRLLFGGVPDRIGGFATALASLAAEAIGLLTIWTASSPLTSLAGVTLTGIGYSLVFPSLGVEALKRATSHNRGLVLGAYLACFDLGLALAGPFAGGVAEEFGLHAAFAAAAGAALMALVLTAMTRFEA
jgi:MFS family permease